MNGPDTDYGATVITSHDQERLDTCSLVLSAAGIEHAIVLLPDQHCSIVVAEKNQANALAEIAAYDQENKGWPYHDRPKGDFTPDFHALSVVFVGCLALLYSLSGPWTSNSEWFVAGAGDSSAILAGELYRLLTALTLHADLVHLLGNCALGAILLHYYFHTFGNGIGLSSLLLTAGLANLLNVLSRGPGHNFVGFSTAIFAVIGMLCALHFHRHSSGRTSRILMPLMAGGALLAMLGSGGERTDLGAHFFGLATGLAWGYLLGLPPLLALRHLWWLQLILFCCSCATFIVAWSVALRY